MAATYTQAKVDAYVKGNKRVRVLDITLSGTYATGGDPLTAVALGLKKVTEFLPHGQATDGTLQYGVQPVYNAGSTQVSVKLFETGTAAAGSAEKGNTESLTGITFRVTVVGF